jgi:DNA-binding NarL/FixJ family response regulator
MLTNSGNLVAGACPTVHGLASISPPGEPKLQAVIVDADDLASGPAVVAEIRRTYPEVKILLLCRAVSPEVVRCAIDERVEGVVLKSDTAEEVILALRNVLEERAVMPIGWQAASLQPGTPLAALSEREREVLELAASGMSNKEIAKRLTISVNTVKFHLRTIYSRLGVRNRVEAMRAMGCKEEDQTDSSNMSNRDGPAARPDPLSAGWQPYLPAHPISRFNTTDLGTSPARGGGSPTHSRRGKDYPT